MVQNINIIRSYLKERLFNNNELYKFDKERKQLLELLQRTINYGESNSILIIGPTGVGKTKVLFNVHLFFFIINIDHGFISACEQCY